jgi:hypothetical protein
LGVRTAFAIEDNNLWLRHLLNLLLQVTLALYVFWKSSSWHSTQVLVPGILVFVAGIIKYGERTAALRHGNLNNMVIISKRKSTTTNNTSSLNSISNTNGITEQQILICDDALRSAPGIRMLFARRKTPQVATDLMKIISPSYYDRSSSIRHRDLFRLMDVELGMMYSDVYTKAAVLRTKRGIVFRCISLACTVAALILFFFFTSSSRADHHDTTNTAAGRVDTAITYTLFIGGLVLDICSLLTMVMASPWTWAWLRDQGHHRIASMSLCLVSCDMVSGWLGTTTTRPLWSNTMGQYRFVCYDDDSQPWSSSVPPPPPTLSERVMGIIRKLVTSEEEKKLFRMSKLLETRHVVVDDNVTKCLVEAINDILQSSGGGDEVHQRQHGEQWECLGQLLLAATQPECTYDFVHLICWLHACTEVLLCEAAAVAAPGAAAASASADVCRKLSRYMVYLVAVHPAGDDLLQVVSSHADKEYKSWERYSNISLRGKQHQIRMGLLRLELEAANRGAGCGCSSSRIMASSLPHPEQWQRTLEELKHMWARLLVYAAAKSRPEAHAAELARGGELLTFVWLLLSHNGLGAAFQVHLVPRRGKHHQHVPSSSESASASGGSSKTFYVFENLPAVQMVVHNCCPQLLLPPEQAAKLTTTPTPTAAGQEYL